MFFSFDEYDHLIIVKILKFGELQNRYFVHGTRYLNLALLFDNLIAKKPMFSLEELMLRGWLTIKKQTQPACVKGDMRTKEKLNVTGRTVCLQSKDRYLSRYVVSNYQYRTPLDHL